MLTPLEIRLRYFVELCDDTLDYLRSDDVKQRHWNVVGTLESPPKGATHLVINRLLGLVERAAELPINEVPPVSTSTVKALKDVTTAVVLAKQVKGWAEGLAAKEHVGTPEAKSNLQPDEQPDKETLTLQEVTNRLKRLCRQGEKYTSQHKLAAQIGCSPALVNKAIKKNHSLGAWMNSKPGAALKAQSINDFVTDQTAQSTEPDPADDAAIHEYLERENLTPEEHAFFNGLSRENQLMFLNDPDKHPQILGRKP